MNLHRSILLLATVFVVDTGPGCRQAESLDTRIRRHEAEARKLEAKILKMNIEDGIDKNEADTIARAYFKKNVGCGGYTKITDGGDAWEVQGLFGLGAVPIQGFRINKRTGEIVSPIGPSYREPKAIFEKAQPAGHRSGRQQRAPLKGKGS